MAEGDLSSLMTVQQAIRIIDSVAVQPRVVRVGLSRALGMCLAGPLTAQRDFPPFDKSLMDGYAVRAADAAAQAELRVIGEAAAGRALDRSIGPGEAASIMTGAPLPAGADAVVPVEDVEKIGAESVRILRAPGGTKNVGQRGSDCPSGQAVLGRGRRLGAVQLGVAAAVGAAELDVFAPPRVAVLATGDELVPIGQTPGPTQIHNSNNPMLVALLSRLGCEVSDMGIVPDRPELIRAAIERGLEHDALFISGGMSMGEYDYVPRLLKEMGIDLKITKLRIKPGKPFVFGVYGGSGFGVQGSEGTGTPPSSVNPETRTLSPSFVFGLPGNPVSAFVCTLRLASRLLARIAGGTVEERWLTGRLDTGMPPNGPREFYQPALRAMTPVKDSSYGEFARVTPLKWKGSADLFTLATANVLLVRPANDPPLPLGTIVRVLEI